jgi:hypothetical protein
LGKTRRGQRQQKTNKTLAFAKAGIARPASGSFIAEIAAEGDRAINKLNACITAYEQVRSQVKIAL